MNIINHKVLIDADTSPSGIVTTICDTCHIGPDEHFAFSGILTTDEVNQKFVLKINCLEEIEQNPYTPHTFVNNLKANKEGTILYTQPPLKQWLNLFRPFLLSLLNEQFSKYEKLIPERDEQLSILYLTVVTLHKEGYYLNKTLIRKAYTNALNKQCRKLKEFQGNLFSLDEEIGTSTDDKHCTRGELLPDPESTRWAESTHKVTDEEYSRALFEEIKAYMLSEMSELSFERILIQLETKTVTTRTSEILIKYREIYAPNNIPRPNKRRSKNGQKPSGKSTSNK